MVDGSEPGDNNIDAIISPAMTICIMGWRILNVRDGEGR